jgi:hypothetical protein
MTIKPILLFGALLTAALLPAQTLIPFQGYKDLFGYATEDGQVVMEPKYKGIFEILPEDRFYTVLRQNGPLLALTRKGELIPIENMHDVVTEVENVRPYARQIDTLLHLVAIVKGGTMLTLRNTRTGLQTEWYSPTRNNNIDWLQVRLPPRGEEMGPLQFTEGALPVWTSPTTLNFIDTDMKPLFDRDFGAGIVADAEHFIVAEGREKLAIADRKGVVRTPFAWGLLQPGGKTGYFIAIGPTYTNNKGGHRYGLINADGGLVLDTIYRSIRPFGDVLIVERYQRYGLEDYQGKTVLPLSAQQIYPVAGERYVLIQDQDPATKAPRAWLMDRKGQRMLSEYASYILAYDRREFPHFVFDYPGRQVFCDTALQVIATLEGNDESMIVETDPWVIQRRNFREGSGKYGLYDVDGQVLTPELFDEMIRVYPRVYEVKSSGRYGVVNERGEEMVPGRYAAIVGSHNYRDTFFRCRQDDGSWTTYSLRGELLPEIAGEANQAPFIPAVPSIPDGFTVVRQPVYETGLVEVKDSLNACGVLNDRGEWVLPPKKGVQYLSLNYYLVLEVPEALAPNLWSYYPFPEKLKLHRVNQGKEPPLEVDYMQYDPLDEPIAGNTRVQKKHPKLPDRKLISAYIDEKGKLLTPFHVLEGPQYLKSRNLLTVTDFKDQAPLRQLVVDDRGKTLYELDTLVYLFPQHTIEWQLDYLIVQKPIQEPVENFMRIKSGMLDTLWQLQIPIEYLNLKVVILDRLFAATDSTHAGLLYDWRGNLLHDFGRRPNQHYSQENPLWWQVGAGQHVVVSDGNTTVLLDEQNRVLRVYDLKSGGLDADKRFFTLIDREERRIWVRVEDGMVYRR